MGWISQTRAALERRAIFSPGMELLNLGLPVVFLVGVLAYGLDHSWTNVEILTAQILANHVFGNGYHVMFSVWNMLYMKEFKTINREMKIRLAGWIALYFVILAFFLGFHDLGFLKQVYPVRFVAVWILVLFPAIHRIRQSMGLSLLYNMNQRRDLEGAELTSFEEREARSRKWEHRAAHMIVFGGLIVGLSISPRAFRLVSKEILAPIGITITVAGFAMLLYALSNLRKWRELLVVKAVFSVRYTLQFFFPYSFLTRQCISAIHGTEYTILNTQMIKRSPMQKTMAVLGPLAALMVVQTFLNSGGLIRSLFHIEHSVALRVLGILSATLTYVHYVMDSVYFRMRNPVLRRELGPLLREPKVSVVLPVETRKVA